jgi:Domain of unknown function (DUF4397)
MTASCVALPMRSIVKSFALVLGSAVTLALTLSLTLGGELQPAGAQLPQLQETAAAPSTTASTAQQTPAGTEHALVRVAHMSGDGTPLAVLVNGEVLSPELAVGQKTSYLPVGQRLVDVQLRDISSGEAQNVSVRQLGKGVHATVFPRPAGTRPAAILVIDNVPLARPDSAAIRFVHLSEGEDDLEVTTGNRLTAVDRLRSTEFQFVSTGKQIMSVKKKRAGAAGKSLLDFQFEAVSQSSLTFVLSDSATGLSVAVIDERNSQSEQLAEPQPRPADLGEGSSTSIVDTTISLPQTTNNESDVPETASSAQVSLTSRKQPTPPGPTPPGPTSSSPTSPSPTSPSEPSSKADITAGPGELALTLDELNGSSQGPAQGAVAIFSFAGVALAVGDRRRRNFNNRI